ncbi:MAG: TIGR02757 family protein [Saprospiraceae bacterium]|nr:TIGR02757 family protein [Saprospiraceae bacterium]
MLTKSPSNPDLKTYLDALVERFNQPGFIADDPISIPHRFTNKQDIEISALWTALIAWGQRKTILQNASQLMEWMDGCPHQFVLQHQETDRKKFLKFKHRTFNGEDAICFLEYFQHYYRENDSLETAFSKGLQKTELHVGPALVHFKADFRNRVPHAGRTLKHIASPETGSRCKRLLMFLRWMVRRDKAGVDFGIWSNISPAQLLLPLDVHVEQSARKLGLLSRKQADWKAVLELSAHCRTLNPSDPACYDFALFGLGLEQKPNFNI